MDSSTCRYLTVWVFFAIIFLHFIMFITVDDIDMSLKAKELFSARNREEAQPWVAAAPSPPAARAVFAKLLTLLVPAGPGICGCTSWGCAERTCTSIPPSPCWLLLPLGYAAEICGRLV